MRRALRLGQIEQLRVEAPELVVDSLLVGVAAREILVAPVAFKSVPLGVIVLATTGTFERDDVELLDHLRADLGLAVNNALAHDRLERLAAVDPLTDAYNRRFGLGRLREEYSRAVRAEARSGSSCSTSTTSRPSTTRTGTWSATASCARSPAPAGASSARATSWSATAARSSWCCCRGRPEDVPGRRAHPARGVRDGGRGRDQRIAVTVSVGGTTYRDTVETPEALVALADRALYEAKDSGRDRLVSA